MADRDYEMLKNWRGRRYLACTRLSEIHNVIENLGVEDGSELPNPDGMPTPPTDMQKAEIQNMAANLLRMILLYNDGRVSPQKLLRF